MRIAVSIDPAPERPPLQRVMQEFRPHRRAALTAACGTLMLTACMVGLPIVVSVVIDKGALQRSTGWVLACTVIGAALVGGQITGQWLEVSNMGRFAEQYLRELRGSMIRHLY